MRELSELGPFAAGVIDAGVIDGDRKAFVAWLKDGRLLTINPPFEKFTGWLSPGERELIRTAPGSLMNASRMIDNVRRVQSRDRLNFP